MESVNIHVPRFEELTSHAVQKISEGLEGLENFRCPYIIHNEAFKHSLEFVGNNCKALRKLWIDEMMLKDEEIIHISHLHNLEQISFWGNPDLTDRCILHLSASRQSSASEKHLRGIVGET